MSSMRQWFNSSCQCDGYNNLYHPHLTCLNDHTGNITSTVHHDDMSTAQQLIDLTTADIQMRDPPVVHLIHGWILCLNANLTKATTASPSPTANPSPTAHHNCDNITSLTLAIMITVGSVSFCVILALITCIIVGLVYIRQKR